MKSQSFIIQFIIFFVVGLGFFLLVGNLFRFQSDFIKQDILDLGLNLSSQQMSSVIIAAVNTCKTCDNVSIKVGVKSIAGHFPTAALGNGLSLSIAPENKFVKSSTHNMNYSVSYVAEELSTVEPITLTYDRIKNNLVIK